MEQILKRHQEAAERAHLGLIALAEKRLIDRGVYGNRRIGAVFHEMRELTSEYHFHMNEIEAINLMIAGEKA